MKAIILERRGDEAAVLCEDGTFANRRVSGEVGETVELSAEVVAFPAQKKTRWARSAVAAALALTVTGGTLGYMGGTASAYVSLDVEDSAIELTVNHVGRVIAVNAVSEDAEPPTQETPQQETNREPTNPPRNDAPHEQREETPAQQNDQPDTQEQPQVEEQPNAEESRPSRESGQPPEQEQPQRGEEMQEQPQQGNERQEQPPQGNEQPQETDQTDSAPSPLGDQPEMQDGDIGAPPDSGNGPMTFAPHGDMRNSGEHGAYERKDMGPDGGTEKRGPL